MRGHHEHPFDQRHEHPHDHPRHRDRGELSFGPPRGRGGRGGRTRRGDIRFALLSALSDEPAHGYELIQRLEERTGGRWKPSPGSVYPTLQMLEETGLVTGSQQDEKRVYAITDSGRTALAERMAEGPGVPPWMHSDQSDGHGGLRQAMGQLALAIKQVAMTGNPEHMAAATAIITDARRKLYQLLADA
jgi:DNA-binding PadR family transcriptional regulator